LRNNVVPYEPTWLDRDFRKALAKLPPGEQEQRLDQLSQLITRLQVARHPTNDPDLARYHPTGYGSVAKIASGVLVEYRPPYPMRVVALWLAPPTTSLQERTVLLLTVTLGHDHERMKTLIKRHSGDLSRFGKDRRGGT
jgi:hypothetical protein